MEQPPEKASSREVFAYFLCVDRYLGVSLGTQPGNKFENSHLQGKCFATKLHPQLGVECSETHSGGGGLTF